MVTATVEEVKGYSSIVSDLKEIETRVRTVSRFDAEALDRIITGIAGPEAPRSRFYNGYRGVSRWL